MVKSSGLRASWGNEKFVANAPEAVVAEEREKLAEYQVATRKGCKCSGSGLRLKFFRCGFGRHPLCSENTFQQQYLARIIHQGA